MASNMFENKILQINNTKKLFVKPSEQIIHTIY